MASQTAVTLIRGTVTALSCVEPEMALMELPMRISLCQAKLFRQDGLPGK
jgi:hypothetical protein